MYQFDLSDAVKELFENGIVSIRLLQNPDIQKWKKFANQDDILFTLGHGYEFHKRITCPKLGELEEMINYLLEALEIRSDILSFPFIFNHTTIYRFRRHIWDKPQRERMRFRKLIAFLVIDGTGELVVYDPVKKRDKKKVQVKSGDLVLMRAPGFANKEERLWYHGSCKSDFMTLFAFRYDSSRGN